MADCRSPHLYLKCQVNLFFVSQVSSTCPSVCVCPREPPKCDLGVSLVMDGCGCCKVCARQLNEDCSNTQPCDHLKGLQCNFGASRGATKGICRGMNKFTLFKLCFIYFVSSEFEFELVMNDGSHLDCSSISPL